MSPASYCGTVTLSVSDTRSWSSSRSTREGPWVNSPLALQIMRFGFLALLWLFVLAAVRVVRSDLRTSGQPRVSVAPPPRRRGSRGGDVNSAPPRAHGPSQLIVTEGGLA